MNPGKNLQWPRGGTMVAEHWNWLMTPRFFPTPDSDISSSSNCLGVNHITALCLSLQTPSNNAFMDRTLICAFSGSSNLILCWWSRQGSFTAWGLQILPCLLNTDTASPAVVWFVLQMRTLHEEDPGKQERRLGLCQDSVTQLTHFYTVVSSGENFILLCPPQGHLGWWNSKTFQKEKRNLERRNSGLCNLKDFKFCRETRSHLVCLNSNSPARPGSNVISSQEAPG